MKKNLQWRVHSLIVMMMVVGLMMAPVSAAQAQAEKPTIIAVDATDVVSYSIPLSPTIDAAGVVSYAIALSPTIAIVDPSDGLNIRKGPNRHDYVRRGGLLKDSKVVIRGTNSPKCLWVYITETSKEFYGWVYSGYLRNLQGNLIYEECPPIIKPEITPTSVAIDTTNLPGNPDETDDSFLESYNMLAIGIIALFLTALLYWIAYTKGFFARLRQTQSSAGISASSKIPKAGTPYLEGILTSTQPIYSPLNGKVISIGRDKENTLVIDSRFAQWDTVSSHHARIEQDGDSFIITDLDSKNGIFVDGRQTQENILYDGMRVMLGQVAFVFRVNKN